MHEAVHEPSRKIRPREPDGQAGGAVGEVQDRTAEVEQDRRFEEIDLVSIRQRNGDGRVRGLAEVERLPVPGGVAATVAHETQTPDANERQNGDAPPGQRNGGNQYGGGVHLMCMATL